MLNVATHEDGPPPAFIQTEISTFLPRHSLLMRRHVIATFESPSRAIQCAQKYGALRLSLHGGECDFERGKPGEAVLAQSAQAVALAAPGEIILTQTLRDILAGSAFEFAAWQGVPARPAHTDVPLYALT